MTEREPNAASPKFRGDLLDVNVWLALAIEEHPHHRSAASYWNRRAREATFFCRLSAMSLVRLLTNSKLMSGKPLTLARAWALYRGFSAVPGVSILAEPEGLDAELAALVTPKLPPRLFTDAYFAALALKAQVRLVTFDRDFERFGRLALLRLSANDH
jgi:uncharacterized protein